VRTRHAKLFACHVEHVFRLTRWSQASLREVALRQIRWSAPQCDRCRLRVFEVQMLLVAGNGETGSVQLEKSA
jgi:hypothetical protein